MTFFRQKPYNDLPLLPPEKSLFETIEVYKKLTQARAVLSELKGRLSVIPNPMMLINTLVLQEARDSSEIENVLTTADKMYKAFTSNSTNIDPATKEVLRYREALWHAFKTQQKSKAKDIGWIVQIFRTITQKVESLRKKQVYIGNAYTIVYTPPEPDLLKNKLQNWLDFFHSDNDIDPLIKMAILHYQFEAIHPFSDGNGRTGRILYVLYLTDKHLVDIPVLYISKHILEFKNEYYRLLSDVTENQNWKSWILYMLEAVYRTSLFTLEKVNAIYDLFNEVRRNVQENAKNIYSRELIEVIFSQIYCKNHILVEHNIASRNTARKYLNKLVEMNILEIHKEGKETLYLNKQLYEILTKS